VALVLYGDSYTLNKARNRDETSMHACMHACSAYLSAAVLPFFIIIAAVATPQLNTYSTTMIKRILRRERIQTQRCLRLALKPVPGPGAQRSIFKEELKFNGHCRREFSP
jgi:hypothetical protein